MKGDNFSNPRASVSEDVILFCFIHGVGASELEGMERSVLKVKTKTRNVLKVRKIKTKTRQRPVGKSMTNETMND